MSDVTDTDDDGDIPAVLKTLGHSGRSLAYSKSHYMAGHPANVVLFNARVMTAGGEQPWWGDIDITRDEAKVHALAGRFGDIVHVMREGYEDHQHERPLEQRAALSVAPTGDTKYMTAAYTRDRYGTLWLRDSLPPPRRIVWAPRRPLLWRI